LLATLPRLDPAHINGVLADGDAAAVELGTAVSLMAEMRSDAASLQDESRLSRSNRQLLAGIDETLQALEPAPATWGRLSRPARHVAALLVAVSGHEDLVFRATSAARRERWDNALRLLDNARTELARAAETRDRLAREGDVTTLDELLARYADYSAALVDLYTALRDGAAPGGPEVAARLDRVERTQAALPADTSALRVAVSEAAGGPVADGVVSLERARAVVTQVVGDLP
ncbi:MAG: hypothetical protein M3N29_06275, partial [Chloroflexota bacterium]|nr:hypothetical protein [Chloroflexota bacterium]